MFIDADTHADECDETWSYIPHAKRDIAPVPMAFPNDLQPAYIIGRPNRGVFIDGQLFARQIRSDEGTGTTEDTRELRDIPARLQQMDELDVDIQIVFPTLLLNEVTRRPEIEVALCESYNRWMSERCSQSGGRLQWAAVLPLRSTGDATRELRRVKEDGAVAIFKRAYECDDRHASDSYFAPVYSVAQDLDLPICIHTGRPYTGNSNSITQTQTILHSALYVYDAFLSIIRDRTYKTYPRLRFGFVEAAASWIPHMLWLSGFDRFVDTTKQQHAEVVAAVERLEEFLSNARLFATCEVSEDIGKLIGEIGDKALVIGSDYGHNDRAAIQEVHRLVASQGGLPPTSVERLTSDNARILYGLNRLQTNGHLIKESSKP